MAFIRRTYRFGVVLASASLVLGVASCGDDSPAGPSDVVVTVQVSPSSSTLRALGDSLQLDAVARNGAGDVLNDATFSWSSSATGVVAVGPSTGRVTAVAPGSAAITASSGGVSGDASVEVTQDIASIVVAPDTLTFHWIGGRAPLEAMAMDANGNIVEAVTDFGWTVVDPAVASVDGSGLVTSKTVGITDVTVELTGSAGVTGTGTVRVASPEAGLAGLTYTAWFGRSDIAPAILSGGKLTTPRVEAYDPIVSPTTPWGAANAAVSKFQWEGDRIGLLTDVAGDLGTLRVRGRTGPWEALAIGTVRDFQLGGDLIAAIHGDGRLDVKRGLDGEWRELVTSGVTDVQLEGSRIGVVETGGLLRVKDGLDGGWEILANSGVERFELEGNTIGVLFDDGRFWYKDDGPSDSWSKLVAAGAQDFDLQGTHIAVLFDDGRLDGRDGVGGNWLPLEPGSVKQFELEGNWIATLRDDGRLRIKNGLPNSWSILVASGADAFQLQGDRIGYVSVDGQLFVKQGIDAPSWSRAGPAHGPGGIDQFRLIVDVPVPPARIQAADYGTEQSLCEVDYQGVECVTPLQEASPPKYGRFCGEDRPNDAQFAGAELIGSIDPLDELCRHHDHLGDKEAPSWYPEISGPEGSCIVYYGLYYGRLTLDGVLVARGSDRVNDPTRWNSAYWNEMPRLKAAIDAYWDTVTKPVTGCGDLAAFEETQAAKHD